MMLHWLTGEATENHRRQIATRAIFFLAGLGMAAWAPLIPFVKARLGIDDGTLGLLLFCLAAGSMAIMPFAGYLIAKLGCRTVLLGAGALLCIDLPLLALIDAPLLMGGGIGGIWRRQRHHGCGDELTGDNRRAGERPGENVRFSRVLQPWRHCRRRRRQSVAAGGPRPGPGHRPDRHSHRDPAADRRRRLTHVRRHRRTATGQRAVGTGPRQDPVYRTALFLRVPDRGGRCSTGRRYSFMPNAAWPNRRLAWGSRCMPSPWPAGGCVATG